MSTYYLASITRDPPIVRPPRERHMIPTLTLESMDGSVQILLDGSEGWVRMPGSTGLEMPPVSVISQAVPNVPGSILTDVRITERPIFLPIYCGHTFNQITFREMLDKLYRLVDPIGLGQFKLVGRSYQGTRELTVTYISGLEGADGSDVSGLSWAKIGLSCVAYDPYPRDREDRSLEFRMAEATTPFMGIEGNSDAPFPVSLSAGSVVGSGMLIDIGSRVPVYPTLDLIGPMDSFLGTLSPVVIAPDGSATMHEGHTWSVDIPAGVPAGQTLRLVTDPRIRSIRLDGELAAGRVARGSTIRPFYPGSNILDVTAPGGTENTRIIITWRELHRSLW